MSGGPWSNARCYEKRFSVTAALKLVRLAKCSCEKSLFEFRSYCHAGPGRCNEREWLFVKRCDVGRVSWLRDSSAHCGGSYRFSVLEGKIYFSVTFVTEQILSTQLQRFNFSILACNFSTLPSPAANSLPALLKLAFIYALAEIWLKISLKNQGQWDNSMGIRLRAPGVALC